MSTKTSSITEDIRAVVSRDGKQTGRVVGASRPCRLECSGRAVPVRWEEGKRLTWPCTKAMEPTEKEGEWKIL